MNSLREYFVFNLSFRNLRRIVRYVIKLRGTSLSQSEFTDHVLLLFEDIPGMELFNLHTDSYYLSILWSLYREYQDHSH